MQLAPSKRIIIDTDPGIDDALAIVLALASPEVQLEALTVVHGNCPLDRALVNAIGILDVAKAAHIPVLTVVSVMDVVVVMYAEPPGASS